MSIALGNEKPEQLLDVEKVIWRTLFTLSEGTKPPEDVLGDLIIQIPWQGLPPCLPTSQQVSEWFTIQATPLAGPPENFLPVLLILPTSPDPVNSTMDKSLDHRVSPQTVNSPQSTLSPTSLDPVNDKMDESLDHQVSPQTVNPPQSTLSPTSLNPDNDAMDESLDHQASLQTVNLPQSTDAENGPPSAPTLNPPPTANQPQSMEPENSPPGDTASMEFERSSSATKDFEGLDSDDTNSDDEASSTQSESGVEESTYRRSRRLALDQSKVDSSLGGKNNLPLTSPFNIPLRNCVSEKQEIHTNHSPQEEGTHCRFIP